MRLLDMSVVLVVPVVPVVPVLLFDMFEPVLVPVEFLLGMFEPVFEVFEPLLVPDLAPLFDVFASPDVVLLYPPEVPALPLSPPAPVPPVPCALANPKMARAAIEAAEVAIDFIESMIFS